MTILVTGQSMMPPGFAAGRGRALEVEMRAETMVGLPIVVSSILEVDSVFEREFGVWLRAWR